MKIEVYAILKDYFLPQFEVDTSLKNVGDLRQYLSAQNPEVIDILKLSRIAIGDEFVDDTHSLTGTEYILVIPPSSGG